MKLNLGTYLKQIREERGLGVRQVSRMSSEQGLGDNLSPSLIVQIENGTIKRPGILKLATLAELYQIDLSILRAYFEDDERQRVSDREAEKIKRVLYSIAETIKLADELEPHLRNKQDAGKFQDRYSQLYVDLLDALEEVDMPLVSASDEQPPIPFSYAERILNEATSEGETRRSVLRLLLTLKGFDLEDAAAAFFAASPRSIRSAILREPIGGPALPIQKRNVNSNKARRSSTTKRTK